MKTKTLTEEGNFRFTQSPKNNMKRPAVTANENNELKPQQNRKTWAKNHNQPGAVTANEELPRPGGNSTFSNGIVSSQVPQQPRN